MPQHYRPSNLDPVQLANLQYQSAMGVGGNQFREDFRKPGAFSNMAKSAAAGLLGAPADVAQLIASTANTGLLGAPEVPFTSQDLEQRFGADTSRPSGLLGMVGAPDPMDVARMAPKGLLAMTLFHGTPHKFDRFALDKIGTGEGAQAFGHGLYFAQAPEVAGQYRFIDARIDPEDVKYGGRSLESLYESAQRKQNAAYRANDQAQISRANAELGFWENLMTRNHPDQVIADALSDPDDWPERYEFVKSLDRSKFEGVKEAGHLYEVDIPDEITDRMLDWDAPLSEQPESVRKGLENLKKELDAEFPNQVWDEFFEDSGEHVIEGLRSNIPPDELNEMFMRNGIPGIRFFDGNSRSAGEGTRNIVVFNPDDIKSVKRDGELVWENRLGL